MPKLFKKSRTAVIGLALTLGLALGSQAFGEKSESRDVKDFSYVKLSGSMDAVITAGEAKTVVIKADADELDQIKTYVEDGVLYIKQKSRRGYWGSSGDVEVVISTPKFDGVTLSGSGDVTARGVDSKEFKAKISGSGDIDLAGRCGMAKLAISGSGDVDADRLKCQDVDIAISGSGDADVHATGLVSVRISGSGDVEVHGGGRVTESRISGSGNLTVRSE